MERQLFGKEDEDKNLIFGSDARNRQQQMKKCTLILSLCLISFVVHAQSDPKTDKQVASIRAAYNKATQMATHSTAKKDKENCMTLTMSRNMPGSGLSRLTTEFFFIPVRMRSIPSMSFISSARLGTTERKSFTANFYSTPRAAICCFPITRATRQKAMPPPKVCRQVSRGGSTTPGQKPSGTPLSRHLWILRPESLFRTGQSRSKKEQSRCQSFFGMMRKSPDRSMTPSTMSPMSNSKRLIS